MDPRKYLSRTGPKPSGFVLRSPLTKGCAGLSAPLRGQRWARMLGPPYHETLAMEKQSCSQESTIKEQGMFRWSIPGQAWSKLCKGEVSLLLCKIMVLFKKQRKSKKCFPKPGSFCWRSTNKIKLQSHFCTPPQLPNTSELQVKRCCKGLSEETLQV